MKLTIIIPTHERISSVVECVAALEHNNAEIIVVDDASQQPVVLPAKSARVIRHVRYRGRSAAVNTGLNAASNDLVLIMSDDIYAAPDMVSRLIEEFSQRKDPRCCLMPRILWDPDVPLTLTMKWMEDNNKFQLPMLLSKTFVLAHGGFDENFRRRSEDVEVQLRLKQHGLHVRTVESAMGFQNNVLKIRDLVEREFLDGVSAVFLHSKFPDFMPLVDDAESLMRSESQTAAADAAVEEIAFLEQSGSTLLPTGAGELYVHVCRHYFQHGVFEGLKDIGGLKLRRGNSGTLAIYQHATHLETIGELDEARRLFRLVLHRPDEGHRDGAEYHLGCIESKLENPGAAHLHFIECLRLNPGHPKARSVLNSPSFYREVEANVFESIEPGAVTKVLFITFGNLAHVVNAFPIVAALREKFHAETVWMTSPEYASLAKASFADRVCESEPRGIIPWDWVQAHGFTHVFFPEPGINQEEWAAGNMHSIDFMARKCGVRPETHKAWLEPNSAALIEAEEFLREQNLKRGGFVAASCETDGGRHWPKSNLMKLAQQIEIPTIVFAQKGDAVIPGTVPCIDTPLEVIAALIRWSGFYLGCNSGVSWLATTTPTPMAVFLDPAEPCAGFCDVLKQEKREIQEFDIYTSIPTVLEHVETISACCSNIV
jgi:hypothetical protein